MYYGSKKKKNQLMPHSHKTNLQSQAVPLHTDLLMISIFLLGEQEWMRKNEEHSSDMRNIMSARPRSKCTIIRQKKKCFQLRK